MSSASGASETWQARISPILAAQLRRDAEVLGLDSRTATTRPCRSVSALGRSNGTMALPEPFRGEVWDVDFDDFGRHPAVVLSANLLNSRLGHVAVIPVTGTTGPTRLTSP